MDQKFKAHEDAKMVMEDNYQDVFSSDLGKIVLEDLKSFCGSDATCIGRTDAETNQMLGARTCILYIHDRIHHRETKRINKIRAEREAFPKEED